MFPLTEYSMVPFGLWNDIRLPSFFSGVFFWPVSESKRGKVLIMFMFRSPLSLTQAAELSASTDGSSVNSECERAIPVSQRTQLYSLSLSPSLLSPLSPSLSLPLSTMTADVSSRCNASCCCKRRNRQRPPWTLRERDKERRSADTWQYHICVVLWFCTSLNPISMPGLCKVNRAMLRIGTDFPSQYWHQLIWVCTLCEYGAFWCPWLLEE